MDIKKVLLLFKEAFKSFGMAFAELGKSICKGIWTVIKLPVKLLWNYALLPVRKALHWFFWRAIAGKLSWQPHKNVAILIVGDPEDWFVYPTLRVKTTKSGTRMTRSVRCCWLTCQVMADFSWREALPPGALPPGVLGTAKTPAGKFEIRMDPKASTAQQVKAVKKVMAAEQRGLKTTADKKMVAKAIKTAVAVAVKKPAKVKPAKAVKPPQTLEAKIRARSVAVFDDKTGVAVTPTIGATDELAAKKAKKAESNRKYKEAQRLKKAAGQG